MPLYQAEALGGTEFTGADAATGLFDPGTNGNTGGQRIQVYIKSLSFTTDGDPTLIEIRRVDPNNPANKPLMMGSPGLAALNDFDWPSVGTLANEDDAAGDGWALEFTTTGNTGDAYLTIDWEFRGQQG